MSEDQDAPGRHELRADAQAGPVRAHRHLIGRPRHPLGHPPRLPAPLDDRVQQAGCASKHPLSPSLRRARADLALTQPALLVCASFTVLHCGFFLAPVPPTAPPRRRLLASLQVELASLAIFTLFTLACVSRLGTATPGLLSSCGGYFVCSALQGCYSLAWMCVLPFSSLPSKPMGENKRADPTNPPQLVPLPRPPLCLSPCRRALPSPPHPAPLRLPPAVRARRLGDVLIPSGEAAGPGRRRRTRERGSELE